MEYTTSKGNKLFLHVAVSKYGHKYYYFSKKFEGSIDLPKGYEIVELKNGSPYLRKIKK